MNIIEFIPFKNESYDCFQNNIISIIKHYYHRDYSPIFWAGFDFEYLKPNCDNFKLDDLFINLCNYETEIKILNDICGIKIDEHKNLTYKDFKKMFNYKIANNEPIGICIDSFYLPWNKYYQKLHMFHFILACGMENSNTVVCYDGFLAEELHSISIDELFNNYGHIIFYENVSSNIVKLQESLCYFKQIILKHNPYKFDQLSELAHDIKNIRVESFNDYINNDINISLLLLRMSFVSWSRYNFANSINYFYRTYNYDLSFLSNQVLKAYESWTKIKMLLTKAMLMKKTTIMEKISKSIENVISEEKIITEIIKGIEEKSL